MRVLIVDDHPIVASGCRALFAGDTEIVILEASDAESGERIFVAERPDICVLDINLPTVSGFELARRTCHTASARIIMFSMNDDPVFAARAIEVGAKGYVSKSGDPYDLVEAIREVGNGGVYLPAAIARSVAFAGPAFAQSPLSKLSSGRSRYCACSVPAKASPKSPGWCTRLTKPSPIPRPSFGRSLACAPPQSWCGLQSRVGSFDAERPSLRAQRSNPGPQKTGLLRRFAPRNDEKRPTLWLTSS